MISMAKPIIEQDEIDAVVEVMQSGMIACGEVVSEFEQKFANYIGMDYGVATTSGTTALDLAMKSLGIGEGDRVITTPFTFIASSNSILYQKATPVFVDIDPKTYLLDPQKLEEYLQNSYDPSIKAIVVVHLYGLSCDMPKIMQIAKKYNITVIEDCAQSHGAAIDGKKSGSFADVSCFSFYPTKNMTTSEGGMVLYKDKNLYDLAKKLINHGRVDQYLHDVLGYNYRMTNIAAAIGLAQLTKVDTFNAKRVENAKVYDELFSGVEGVITPYVADGFYHVYHQYTINVGSKRDQLQEYLKNKQIGSAIVYPFSMQQQPFYKGVCEYSNLDIATQTAKEVLSIPVHPSLTQDDVQTVADAVIDFIKG